MPEKQTSRRRRLPRLLSLTCLVSVAPALAKPPVPSPRPLTDPVAVTSCATCVGGAPLLAGGDAADLLGAWEAGSSFRVFLRLFDANANADWQVEISPGGGPGLGGLTRSDGGWVIAFHHPGKVYVQRVDGATPAGSPLQINDRDEGDAHASTVAASGERVLATFDVNGADGTAMVAQMLSDRLTPIGGRVALGPAHYRAPSAACFRPDRSALVAWSASPDLQRFGVTARRLDDDGATGEPVTLEPARQAQATFPTVACLPDGSHVVAWTTDQRPHAKKGWDVVWQWFDPQGRRRGPVTPLNANRKGDQTWPQLMRLSDGGVLAVWESREGDATVVRGRKFSALGKPRGGEVVLHRIAGSTPAGTRLAPIPGTGRFALAWRESGQGWIQVFAE